MRVEIDDDLAFRIAGRLEATDRDQATLASLEAKLKAVLKNVKGHEDRIRRIKAEIRDRSRERAGELLERVKAGDAGALAEVNAILGVTENEDRRGEAPEGVDAD